MAIDPRRFFDGLRYLGRVRAPRVTYHVYDGAQRYLLLWESRPHTFSVAEVSRTYVEDVHKRFRKKVTTSVEVRQKVGGPSFGALRALLVLAARGEAKPKLGKDRALQFRIYA